MPHRAARATSRWARPLRDEGLLIDDSGDLVLNLRPLRASDPTMARGSPRACDPVKVHLRAGAVEAGGLSTRFKDEVVRALSMSSAIFGSTGMGISASRADNFGLPSGRRLR